MGLEQSRDFGVQNSLTLQMIAVCSSSKAGWAEHPKGGLAEGKSLSGHGRDVETLLNSRSGLRLGPMGEAGVSEIAPDCPALTDPRATADSTWESGRRKRILHSHQGARATEPPP